MSLKNPETLRKCYKSLQSQIPKLKFSKMLIFLRALQKLQTWVNFSFFLFWIILFRKMTFIVSVKPNEIKNWRKQGDKS